MIFKRISQLWSVFLGYLFKIKYDIIGLKSLPSLTERHSTSPRIIVSLTSYGRRVSDVVPYTLISLLKQSELPDRIILWLDDNNWNYINLPPILYSLKKHGVEIYFCKDLRSYKKLIPTLELCPDDTIITVDDDIVYRKDAIADLVRAHKEFPDSIICNIARFPRLDSNNKITPYESWIEPLDSAKHIMPIGAGGILYPPHTLDKAVSRVDLFQELAPMADDIWFWVMGIKNGTSYKVINQEKSIGTNFDDLYQYFHKKTALTHINRKEGANDVQLARILSYFDLDLNDYENS